MDPFDLLYLFNPMALQAIKVSDLLHNLGSQDTIPFEKVKIDDVDLHPEHLINGIMDLQSMSAERVGATFREVECGLNSVCDHCGKTFIRPIWIDHYDCTFTSNISPSDIEDEVFPIDDKENIHIDEPLRQAILLDTPVAVHCIDCINDENLQANALTPDEIEEIDYSEEGGTVQFH